MAKRDMGKLVSLIFLLIGAATLVVLPACGDAAGDMAPTPTALQATPTATPAPTATAKATAAPTPTVSVPDSSEDDGLAQGKLIYEKTAGGLGCAFCHGFDAKGGGVSGEGAPDIRGVSKSMIRGALAGGVPLMGFIKLNEEDLAAVAEYVSYISKQP